MTASGIAPGIYRHYKGKLYFVLGLSRHTETCEVCVVYRTPYEAAWPQLVHRPLAMFCEEVELDGRRVPRFAPAWSGLHSSAREKRCREAQPQARRGERRRFGIGPVQAKAIRSGNARKRCACSAAQARRRLLQCGLSSFPSLPTALLFR